MARRRKVGVVEATWWGLAERHGGRVLVFSKGDWARVRATTRRFPEAHRALKSLGVRMTPVDIRDLQGRVPPEPARGRGAGR